MPTQFCLWHIHSACPFFCLHVPLWFLHSVWISICWYWGNSKQRIEIILLHPRHVARLRAILLLSFSYISLRFLLDMSEIILTGAINTIKPNQSKHWYLEPHWMSKVKVTVTKIECSFLFKVWQRYIGKFYRPCRRDLLRVLKIRVFIWNILRRNHF